MIKKIASIYSRSIAVSLIDVWWYRKTNMKLHCKPHRWSPSFTFCITGGKFHGNVRVRLYYALASTHWILIRVCRCSRNFVPSQSIAVRSTMPRNQWDEQEITNEPLVDRSTPYFFPLKFPMCWGEPALCLLFSFASPVDCAVGCFGTTFHRHRELCPQIRSYCDIPSHIPWELHANGYACPVKTCWLSFFIWLTQNVL